jgi:hypothetical protein
MKYAGLLFVVLASLSTFGCARHTDSASRTAQLVPQGEERAVEHVVASIRYDRTR